VCALGVDSRQPNELKWFSGRVAADCDHCGGLFPGGVLRHAPSLILTTFSPFSSPGVFEHATVALPAQNCSTVYAYDPKHPSFVRNHLPRGPLIKPPPPNRQAIEVGSTELYFRTSYNPPQAILKYGDACPKTLNLVFDRSQGPATALDSGSRMLSRGSPGAQEPIHYP